jgi:hypothetical protein
MKRIVTILILCTIILSIGCNEDVTGESNYPTVFKKLNEEEIENRFDLFYDTPLYGCALLNDYGFFSFNLNDKTLCSIKDSVESAFTPEELVEMAKNSAIRYSELCGIYDTSLMKLQSITTLKDVTYDSFKKSFPDSFPNAWKITFQMQYMEGMEIRGTTVTMVIDTANVIAFDGNWYSKINIPDSDKISEKEAQELLFNKKLTYRNITFTPNSETLWRQSKKIIVPVNRSGQVEIHVCWALFTGSWEIIIDTQTGEQLSAIELSSF